MILITPIRIRAKTTVEDTRLIRTDVKPIPNKNPRHNVIYDIGKR